MTMAVTVMGKVHTNRIDGYWGCFKNCMRGVKSLRTETQPLFLAEFMWILTCLYLSGFWCSWAPTLTKKL